LFVGNDIYRDVHGARKLGIKTVFFKSDQGQQEKDGIEPDYIISNLNHYPAINCRAITGYPYGISESCKDDT